MAVKLLVNPSSDTTCKDRGCRLEGNEYAFLKINTLNIAETISVGALKAPNQRNNTPQVKQHSM
jgi:hypothetical protein